MTANNKKMKKSTTAAPRAPLSLLLAFVTFFLMSHISSVDSTSDSCSSNYDTDDVDGCDAAFDDEDDMEMADEWDSFMVPTGLDSIENFLKSDLFEDERVIKKITERLHSGGLVVIKCAFLPDFAEGLHSELVSSIQSTEGHDFIPQEVYDDEGGLVSRRHTLDRSKYTKLLNATHDMFNSFDTQQFISHLTGRKCTDGYSDPSVSLLQSGDHAAIPQSGWDKDHTVAYHWQLTKDWNPEWGGQFHWCKEGNASKREAIFNTLFLYSVNYRSCASVSPVNKNSDNDRQSPLHLSVNGFFTHPWMPSFDTYPHFEDYYASNERLMEMTKNQAVRLIALAKECREGTQPDLDRCSKIEELEDRVQKLLFRKEEDVMVV